MIGYTLIILVALALICNFDTERTRDQRHQEKHRLILFFRNKLISELQKPELVTNPSYTVKITQIK